MPRKKEVPVGTKREKKEETPLKWGRKQRPEAPKFKKGETVKIEGFSHGWYEGWDRETGDIFAIVACHEDEGPVRFASDRISPSQVKIKRT